MDSGLLERAFDDCFSADYRTILIGGGSEPVYLPSGDLTLNPHRIIYREDFFASALHEVAHWCLGGCPPAVT
jgi:elongation factor P hydroxylase